MPLIHAKLVNRFCFTMQHWNTISSLSLSTDQRWSRGHKARGQGQGQGHKKNPRPRPRPRTAFPRTDALEAKDRNARGLQKKKKKRSSQKFFRRSPKKKKKKKVFTKIFQAISTKKRFDNFSSAPQNFNIPKNSAVRQFFCVPEPFQQRLVPPIYLVHG